MHYTKAFMKPKILLLLPFPPHLKAAHGGSRVIAQLIMRLAEDNRIAILYLRGTDDPPADEMVCQSCEVCEEIKRPDYDTPWQQWQLRLRFAVGFLLGRPMWAVQWDVPTYRSRLWRLVDEWQPDIVQAEFHIMGQYLFTLPQDFSQVIFTEHEPGSKSAPYLLGIYPKLSRLIHQLDRISWDRYERRLLHKVKTAVVFTEEDRKTLLSYHVATPIVRIPLGNQPLTFALNAHAEEPASMLFVGNYVHGPNIDAAMRLVTDILPLVLRQVPNAHLYIVGSLPPRMLRHANNEHVTVTGFVPDVTPYLERATVIAVPLRLGGGMRVKVMEALSAGKAIVATPLAIQGMDVIAGRDLLVAESNQQFCDAIVQLLNNSVQRAALATAAARWAAQNLDWGPSITAYGAIYDNLLQATTRQQEAASMRYSLWKNLQL
jgi:glycosyltransferase involved in cell wall biosynthesis